VRRESHGKSLMNRYLLTLFILSVPITTNALNLDGVIDAEWENAMNFRSK